MTFKQGLILGVVFLVIALAGSGGIAYGVVELSGAEGPRGEQGAQGPKGATGARGAAGTSGSSSSIGTESALTRLAIMWSLNTVIEQFNKTGFTSGSDPQVIACFEYIMSGEGSFVECGFER